MTQLCKATRVTQNNLKKTRNKIRDEKNEKEEENVSF